MKKIKSFSRLKKHHKRQLGHVIDRRKKNPGYEGSWYPRTPLASEAGFRPFRRNWEETAIHLVSPPNMSFIRNPEKIINFFKRVEDVNRKGENVFLDFENVTSLTSDTMLLMVARTADLRFSYGQRVGGAMPLDEKSRTVFQESGAFGDKKFSLNEISQTKGSIQRYSNFQVSTEKADYLTNYAKDYYKSREQSAANYELLIELMTNTNMHAGGTKVHEESWWCSVYVMPDRAMYNFLDNGLGICETASKRIGRKILEFVGLSNDASLLENILNDKIESRTGKYYHGRGLPLIYRRAQNKLIDNVIIITNKVFANVSEGIYEPLNTNFKGTFVHWEVPNANSNEYKLKLFGIKNSVKITKE